MGKVFDLIKEKPWKKMKKDQWLILFLGGILLLVIALPMDCGSGGRGGEEKQVASFSDTTESGEVNETIDYETRLEQQLAETLAQMEGVGRVQVMITFRDAGETVVEKDTSYATQEETTENSQGEVTKNRQTESGEVTVYDTDSDEGAPFIRKKAVPSIEGVLIVAEGGGKKTVAANISEAVEALFGLEVHKIKVVEMNQVQEGSE